MIAPPRGGAGSLSVAAASLAFLLASACGRSEERASELALRDAIDAVRDFRGTPEGRRSKLATVKQLPASTPAASEAKDACLRAYEALSNAEDAIGLAELHMAHAQKLGEIPVTILTEVAAAETLLTRAKADMPACEQAAGRLAIVTR